MFQIVIHKIREQGIMEDATFQWLNENLNKPLDILSVDGITPDEPISFATIRPPADVNGGALAVLFLDSQRVDATLLLNGIDLIGMSYNEYIGQLTYEVCVGGMGHDLLC